MALKLKLKVPSTETPQPNGNSGELGTSGLPKLKIKPPAPKANGKISKKNLKESKQKHKKLKISLTQRKPEVDNVGMREIGQVPRTVPKVRIKPTRVPGDGYDSEAPDIEDDPLIEQGIVVRFLNDANLDFVHNAVDSGDLTGLNIKWVTREKAVVNVNGTLYSARLFDLPTITELYKTIDKKNIFKTIDLCQILLVLHPVNPADLNLDRDFEVPSEKIHTHPLYGMSPKNELKPSKLVYRDGLIYPFQEVHRRFRPRKANHRVIQDIDLRIEELIRLDDEAEETHFEVIDLKKQQSQLHRYANVSNTSSAVNTPSAAPPNYPSAYNNSGEENEEELEEEIQIDDGDLEEELAKALENSDGLVGDINMDQDDGEEVEVEGEQGDDDEDEDDDEDDDDEDDDEDDDDGDDNDENDDDDEDDESKAGKQHVKMLEEEIAELEKAVEVHGKGLASATHKMMKMKFQTSYNTLKSSLDTKKRELAKIASDQQQLQHKMDPNKDTQYGEDRHDDIDDLDDLDDLNDHDDHDNHDDHEDTRQPGDYDEGDDNLDDIDDLF